MENKGIEVIYKDGTKEYYDPISDWISYETVYIFYVGGNRYSIEKEEILALREYNLCEDCGYGLFEEGCRRCISEKELKAIKDDRTER